MKRSTVFFIAIIAGFVGISLIFLSFLLVSAFTAPPKLTSISVSFQPSPTKVPTLIVNPHGLTQGDALPFLTPTSISAEAVATDIFNDINNNTTSPTVFGSSYNLDQMTSPKTLSQESTDIILSPLTVISNISQNPMDNSATPSVWPNSIIIQGVLKDETSGIPISGAKITINGFSEFGITDENGNFSFSYPFNDPYKIVDVSIAADGYGTWSMKNTVLYQGLNRNFSVINLNTQDQIIEAGGLPRVAVGNVEQLALGNFSTSFPNLANQAIPTTIKVGRTGFIECSPWLAAGRPIKQVDVVDFNQYVKNVLPNEVFPTWHTNSLRAMAVAIKMYAWRKQSVQWWQNAYRIDVDVVDNTCDQYYVPNTANPNSSTDLAVDATWSSIIQRNGYLLSLHYMADCEIDFFSYDEPCMSQNKSQELAKEGYDWQAILHYFYDPIQITNGDNGQVSDPNGLGQQIDQGNKSGEPTTISLLDRIVMIIKDIFKSIFGLKSRQIASSFSPDDDTCAYVITGDITILGNGATLRRDSINAFSIFCVAPGGKLTLENITIENGLSPNDGGAIRNFGTLILKNVSFQNNHALGTGGAIWNSGTLQINDSLISGNKASAGSALYNSGNATVNSTCISGNPYTSVYSTVLMDAKYNWWGAENGPGLIGKGWGDTVSENVVFEPFLTQSILDCLTIKFITPKMTKGNYSACPTNVTNDWVSTVGVGNRQIKGWVRMEYVVGNDRVLIHEYLIDQVGDINLEVSYPPSYEWLPVSDDADISEIHVDLSLEVYEDSVHIFTFGPEFDWGVYCHDYNRPALAPSPTIEVTPENISTSAPTPEETEISTQETPIATETLIQVSPTNTEPSITETSQPVESPSSETPVPTQEPVVATEIIPQVTETPIITEQSNLVAEETQSAN